MSLFVCDNCDTIDNTATGHYWARRKITYSVYNNEELALCACCVPTHYNNGEATRYNGEWHNRFKKEKMTQEIIDGMDPKELNTHYIYLGRFKRPNEVKINEAKS